jgi:hypothetical protein
MCWRSAPCSRLSALFCWVHSEFRVSKDNASLKQRVLKKSATNSGHRRGHSPVFVFCQHRMTSPRLVGFAMGARIGRHGLREALDLERVQRSRDDLFARRGYTLDVLA